MHQYQLHREVDAECVCCRMLYPVTFTSKHDQVVCKSCIRHVGGDTPAKIEQRANDHLGLWVSEVQALEEELDDAQREFGDFKVKAYETQRRLQGEIEHLTDSVAQGLSDRSPEKVRQIMTQHVVTEAEDARDAAYRSRDRLYGVLWRLDGKHRPDSDGVCICKRPNCSVLDVIDEDEREGLYRWERKQIERAKKRQSHGLPRDHPDYVDPRGWLA